MIPNPRGESEPAPLEHSVSLASFCHAAGLDPSAPDLLDQIERRLGSGRPEVDAWLDVAAGHLDWLAELLGLTLSPQAIILCGTAPSRLIGALTDRVTALRSAASPHPQLVAGLSDPWIVAIGAAAEPISRTFDPRYSALLKV